MVKTKIVCIALALIFAKNSTAQINPSKKGEAFFSWGYNRGWYTKSNIEFTGDNYAFTLSKVQAKDRQSDLGWDPYFQINKLTIPQYNLRIGYFVSDKYSVTLGWDHMKYVMIQDQTVKINGNINLANPSYNGNYNNDNILLHKDFLSFEHTDGLNYANIELRRFDPIWTYKKIKLNLTTGSGIGILYPRSNVGLLNFERSDQWHFSGYGASAVAGLNATFLSHYFLQTELKAGYIGMNDILTTYKKQDRAKQQFGFLQWNVVFGAQFKLNKKQK